VAKKRIIPYIPTYKGEDPNLLKIFDTIKEAIDKIVGTDFITDNDVHCKSLYIGGTKIWVDNGTIYADAGSGPPDVIGGIEPDGEETGGTELVGSYIKATGLSPGDVHISDGTNWDTDKAEINQIRVITTSVDWDLYILQNDNGYATDDATIPKMTLATGASGNWTIERDFDYEDEDASGEVHFYIVDNDPGGSSFTIIVRGRPLT